MMKDLSVDTRTKKAWQNNWRTHGIDEIMMIFGYERVKRSLARMLEVMPKNGKILEGGCGLGPWVIKLRSLGYDITGVDYDGVSVGKIKEYDPGAKVVEANIEDMPFNDDHFDAYISLGVLEHFYEGPEKAVKEASRVLKNGGLFYVVLPYNSIFVMLKSPLLWFKNNNMLRKIFGKEEKVHYYEKYFKAREICDILRENRFMVKSVEPVDHIFSLVQFSGIFREKGTYDGENALAVKCADIVKRIMPWLTAGSMLIIATNNKMNKGEK